MGWTVYSGSVFSNKFNLKSTWMVRSWVFTSVKAVCRGPVVEFSNNLWGLGTLSYRAARLAELKPWNRFLCSFKNSGSGGPPPHQTDPTSFEALMFFCSNSVLVSDHDPRFESIFHDNNMTFWWEKTQIGSAF
jgi:hypothetical protein